MLKLKNKVAVITGGSSGIGLATAKLFIAQGAKVVISGRNNDKLELAKKEINDSSLLTVKMDVSKLADIKNLYEKTEHAFGKIDVLFANAGILGKKKLAEIDEDFFEQLVDINYKGTFFTVNKAINYLNTNSSVILMSSIARILGRPEMSIHASIKSAIVTLAQCFASELTDRNIRVNSISPGLIKTSNVDKYPQEKLDMFSKIIPIGRMGESDEIAKLVLFLASEDSSYITGSDFIIDGGLSRFMKR
ncbi:MAG: SDR family oxidoreductase [Gammaproteobacteria bacterium]|jgi:NAD(P)-dependent dehydrogenase (short-subunit alcohol dehydrogenase family)